MDATTFALFPYDLWPFALVPFALSSHLLCTSFSLYSICSIPHLLYDSTRHLLYNLKIHCKIDFIGIHERNLTMKCGNIFWKIRKFLNLAVLISSSKFIMTSRLLNNKRGKTNLICGENYIYITLNKQGGYQYWRCLE